MLAEAAALLKAGRYFECHEILEVPWRGSRGRRRLLLQGLIQAAAGLHHWARGSEPGCRELLALAREKLSAAGSSAAATRGLERPLEAFARGLAGTPAAALGELLERK